MSEESIFEVGDTVRIKSDPGAVGVFAGPTRQQGPILKLKVVFPTGTRWVPEDQLEAEAEEADILDDLRSGRFGTAEDLRRLLTQTKLNGKLANVIYSLDATKTDFYAHQFKPLVRLLASATPGILIADEVGIGKTIEAGLIWTELRSRFDMKRAVVICPAVLREKWRNELKHRFGVEAKLVNAGELREALADARKSRETEAFCLIASFQSLRPPSDWAEREPGESARTQLAYLLDELNGEAPLLDLVVFDEAHYMRNPSTSTSQLGDLLRPVADYLVLLSATPVHLKSRDLFELVRMIDPDRFERPESFDQLLEANGPLLRLQDQLAHGAKVRDEVLESLDEAARDSLLVENHQLKQLIEQIREMPSHLTPAESTAIGADIESINLMANVVTRTRKRDVQEGKVTREVTPLVVAMTPVERDFYDSVTEAIRTYAEESGGHSGFLLTQPQRQIASSMAAAFRSWRRRDNLERDVGRAILEDLGSVNESLSSKGVPGPLTQAIMDLTRSVGDFETLRDNDSKFAALEDFLANVWREDPEAKIVLFSYFRPTLEYLDDRLSESGVDTLLLHGGAGDKNATQVEFRSRKGPCILLSSEVGSEGIDLQFAGVLVNYDLPWNPMRIEQRIGRIDRLGQKAEKILICNMVFADTIDHRIDERLRRRVGIAELALGGHEEILGKEIEKLGTEAVTMRLSDAQLNSRIEQAALAVENVARNERQLVEEASHLVAHGDFITAQINESREFHRRVSGHDIHDYVAGFLTRNYQGSQLLQVPETEDLLFDVRLSDAARVDLTHFLADTGAYNATGLTNPRRQSRKCLFANRVVNDGDSRVEVVSPVHPLVRFAAKRQSEESISFPAIAIKVLASDLATDLPKGVFVFVTNYWSVEGLTASDILYFAATPLGSPSDFLSRSEAEKLVHGAAWRGRSWLGAANDVDVEAAWEAMSSALGPHAYYDFHEFQNRIVAQNKDRAELQRRTANSYFHKRLATHEDVRQRHLDNGREPLARAEEGKMAKLRDTIELKLKKIDSLAEVRTDNLDLSGGVIRIE